MKTIKLELNFGLNEVEIETIQDIENRLDEALLKVNFVRSTSTKGGDFTEFKYIKHKED